MREFYFTTNSFAILPNETLETHPMVYGKSLAYWLSHYIQQANPLHINHDLKSIGKLNYTEFNNKHNEALFNLNLVSENRASPLVLPEHKSWNIICQKKPYLIWISCSSVETNLSPDLDKQSFSVNALNENENIKWRIGINYKFGLCSLNNLSQAMKEEAEQRINLLSNFILHLLQENGINIEKPHNN